MMSKNDRLELIEITTIIIINIIIIVVVVWSSPLHLFALVQYSAPSKPYSPEEAFEAPFI